MKRIGNITDKTASNQNIILAWMDVCKNRHNSPNAVERFASYEENLERNLNEVQEIIINGNWTDIKYKRFQRVECGKKRDISFNDSVRDSVIQHALAQTAGQILIKSCILDTYSGFKNRGMSFGRKRMVKFLSEYARDESIYVLKFDVRHYYDNIDNEILKNLIACKIKDAGILRLFNALIDSYPCGLPIGNFLSQLLANFYLSPFDHFMKDELGNKHYARYCDDGVNLKNDKQEQKRQLPLIIDFMHDYKLSLKPNVQIFPIERHGIDFLGYVFKRDGVYLRKRIERNVRRSYNAYCQDSENKHNLQSILSYYGWAKYLTKGGAFWNAIVGKTVKDLAKELKEMAA